MANDAFFSTGKARASRGPASEPRLLTNDVDCRGCTVGDKFRELRLSGSVMVCEALRFALRLAPRRSSQLHQLPKPKSVEPELNRVLNIVLSDGPRVG